MTTPDPPAVNRTSRSSASIVLATHARPAFLSECVGNIVAAMAEGDELIVVECCNTDATGLLGGFGDSVIHLSGDHACKTAKLNAGIRVARGDVVLITDDDCRVPADWVDAIVRPFANPVVGVAFGPVQGLSSLPGDAAPPAVPPGPAPPELWNYAHGASMAVRRTAVFDVGGFDERLGAGTAARGGEEADIVLRMAARGWSCAVADTTPVHHLDWRDQEQTMQNLLGYQRGGGAYLGTGLRRDPRRVLKTFLLRLSYERGTWRERRTRGHWFGPRMSIAFVGGLLRGASLAPRRCLARSGAAELPDLRPRVLWVTDEPPDRHGGGGNIRQARLLESLHGRIDVTLLIVGQIRDEHTRRHTRAVLELARPRARAPLGVTARRVRQLWRVLAQRRPSDVADAGRSRRVLQPTLRRVADDFDAVVVQHLSLAPLIPAHHRARWLLEIHNVPSERSRQELVTEPGRRQRWLLAREAATAERYERQAVRSYDGVVFVSNADAVAVTGDDGQSTSGTVFVIPNGVATSTAPTPLPEQPNILLPATLDYRPNVLGVLWFCEEVLPLLQSKVPGLSFKLVGRNPVPEVMALADEPGVEVHPNVPAMAPWLSWARLVVVPLRIGTGTRLKALEAMAAGRTLVGTSIGLEGLGIVDGVQARVVDDPAAMAAIIADLLTCNERANALADAARRHVAANFRWEVLADRYADALEALTRDPSHG